MDELEPCPLRGKTYLLTVVDESIADDNALRQVVQTARFHGFEVSEHCVGNGEDCHGDYLYEALARTLESQEYGERTCGSAGGDGDE